jgi:dihydroorotate dehydrogenase
MYKIIRFFLFMLDAETAHQLTLNLLKYIIKIPFISYWFKLLYHIEDKRLEKKVFGLRFKNPVGLAAGLDKNAECIDAFAALGFGFVEIGTVTPLPQPGNDKPRLFRIIQDEAIINRMGFNNEGAEKVKTNITTSKLYKLKNKNTLIGGNIGKNKVTANENAVDDYIQCFHILYEVVDYFAVNISSPNTPNLRDLQEREPLEKLLTVLQRENKKTGKPKPILLKIAPDLSNPQLDEIVDVVTVAELDGIIATNTTIGRENLSIDAAAIEKIGNGGLSGKPLTQKSTEIIRYLSQKTGGKISIIAAGGIMSADDALEKLNAGASLVQLYTGFIYKGAGLIKAINRSILANNELFIS